MRLYKPNPRYLFQKLSICLEDIYFSFNFKHWKWFCETEKKNPVKEIRLPIFFSYDCIFFCGYFLLLLFCEVFLLPVTCKLSKLVNTTVSLLCFPFKTHKVSVPVWKLHLIPCHINILFFFYIISRIFKTLQSYGKVRITLCASQKPELNCIYPKYFI